MSSSYANFSQLLGMALGGSPPAMRELGIQLKTINALGAMDSAVEWLTKAADLGDARSAFELGLIYSTPGKLGWDEGAKFWFSLAAHDGVAEAMVRLSAIIRLESPTGESIDADFWTKKARSLGYMDDPEKLSATATQASNVLGRSEDTREEEEWFQKFESLIEVGNSVLKVEQYQEAEPHFAVAVQGQNPLRKILRVHELANELGMTIQETLDLCIKLGIGVETQSSTIIEQQADRVRIRAQREGLARDERPEDLNSLNEEVDSVTAERTFERWLARGRQWIVGAEFTVPNSSQLLKQVYDDEYEWASPISRIFGQPPSGDWLDEILARAENLQPNLKHVPNWPMQYLDESLEIILFTSGDAIQAWVGKNKKGFVISLSPMTFEVKCLSYARDREFASGAALSWFLDSAVCLRHGSHQHYEKQLRMTNSASLQSHQKFRDVYVPRTTFRQSVQWTAVGTHRAPLAHRVKGHVRTLAYGQTPNPDSQKNAPAYVRRNLGPRDTFVRGHNRGLEEQVLKLRVHLGKNSNLADALGRLSSRF